MSKILIGRGDTDLDYPICRPSLDLDFTQEVLDPRITFTRGSIGTRVNRNRLIETVSANQPRFDYDPVTGECKGLLIEESRSNSWTYSGQNVTTNWGTGGGGTLSFDNTQIAPDGSTNVVKFTENTSFTSGRNFSQTISVTSGTSYTFSIFVKQPTGSPLRYPGILFPPAAFTTAQIVSFDPVSGAILYNPYNNTAFVQKYPNGWWKFSATATATTTTSGSFQIRFTNSMSSSANPPYGYGGPFGNYTGDGSSYLYFFGPQVEQGAFPTSYIPTTASTVTRTADLASITGTNFSSWYNSSEGTLYASAAPSTNAAYTGWIYLLGTDFNNGISFYRQLDYQPVIRIRSNVRDEYNKVIGAIGFGQIWRNAITLKSAFGFKTNDFNSCVSGFFQNTSRALSGTLPTFTGPLWLGGLNDGTQKLNGTISRLTYYPRRLKDFQLSLLTQ